MFPPTLTSHPLAFEKMRLEEITDALDPLHDGLSPQFFEGATAFNRGAYFLAHEHWEQWWIALGRPERGLSKALIQLAAAMYHLQRGNRRGCAKLLDSARGIVAQAKPTVLNAAVAELSQAVAICFAAAEQGGPQPPVPVFAAGHTTTPCSSVSANAEANAEANGEITAAHQDSITDKSINT